MVKHIEHIGVAVDNIEEALKTFEVLLSSQSYKKEIVESEGVKTAFIRVGESKVELLEATNKDSPIAKFLKTNKRGFHHIAFEVDNIDVELKRLKNKGFKLIHEAPKSGADNKQIAFLHPKSTQGILVELCQEKRE